MDKNIYLVGFMGTGKSTVGRVLSEKLKRNFVETDEMIEDREKMEISNIFSQEGEKYFREVEKEVLRNISKRHSLVVGCGGGIVIDKDNVSLMKNTGIIICLYADNNTIYQRIKEETFRPLLDVPRPLEKIGELLAKRAPFYKKADIFIDTANINPDEVASRIIDNLDNG